MATAIRKVFSELGEPNAYIEGEEMSGAFVVGLRYGKGTLHMASGGSQKVFWQGPSVGFDWGGNAAKVFTLVYDLPSTDAIFRRFPGSRGQRLFHRRGRGQLSAGGRHHAGADSHRRRAAPGGEHRLSALQSGTFLDSILESAPGFVDQAEGTSKAYSSRGSAQCSLGERAYQSGRIGSRS